MAERFAYRIANDTRGKSGPALGGTEGGAENASTGKRKYGKCKYNANLQSDKKKFGTLQVSVVHF